MRPASLAAYGATVLAAVALDQTTKFLVETGLDMHAQLDVLPFFALFRTHNTGIAFSMLSDFGSIGLVAVTLAVTALILWIAARTEPDQHLARLGFALIVGGALGNLIDRIWHGYVIDFLLFHLPGWSFAIFNLADVFITLGAGMVILDEFLIWRRTRRQ